MKLIKPVENISLNIVIQTCGLLTVSLGLSAIIGWMSDFKQLASFDFNQIPMALSSALLFVIFGLIIFFNYRFPSGGVASLVAIFSASAATLIALLFLFLSLNGIKLDIEHLGIKMNGVAVGTVAGHMSPVAAFCFLLVGLSVIILSLKSSKYKLLKLSLFFASLIFIISTIFLLSYLFGAPLLYGGSLIPPSLPASLAFLLLGIALIILSGLKVWSFERLSGALSLRYSYVLALVFIVLIIGVIIGGYSYYKSYESQYLSEIENRLSAITELKVSELVHWRNERLSDALVFYKNPNFSSLIEKYFRNENDSQSVRNIKIWMVQYLTDFQYDRLCLHDANGIERLVFAINPALHSVDFNKSFLDVIRSGIIDFEDFTLNDHDKRIYLNLSVPIFDSKDIKHVIGLVSLRIDPEQYLYRLIKRWPAQSKTADILLVKRDGNNALYLNDLRFRKNTALNLRVPLTNQKVTAAMAVLGNKGIVDGVDYRGVPVIAYLSPVPNSPWFLISRMDVSEVYAPLRERFWSIIVLVGLFLIGSGAGMGLVWWKQRSKFNHERYESNENIRKLNRVYVVLSGINEAIVRIRNPQELFRKACSIAVEKGGFLMAWIGKINPQSNIVDIIASNGLSENHFQKIDAYLNSDEIVSGIAGQSVKNGSHVISNEILNDDVFLPLHNNSVAFGYKSLGAFPLKVFGSVWGVFNLYSAESGFFDPEEIKLLDELAMDISFAIEVAEKEIERGKAESSLKLANIELENLHNNLDEAVFAIDIINNKMLRVSIAHETVYGYSVEEFFRNPQLWYEIIIPEDKSIINANMPVLAEGKNIRQEFRILHGSGQIRWLEAKIKPTLDNDGKLILIDGIVSDISERKRFELELIHSKENAEAANNLKDAFIANISHEIRTPLNGVLGMTSIIKDSYSGIIKQEDQELFSGIDFSCHRIIRTVDMILNYSRMQVGEFPLSMQNINLADLSMNLVTEFGPAAKSKSLELTFQNNCGDSDIFADRYSITMAVSNLIDNAIKYTPKGFVHVIIHKGPDKETILTVNDSGIGIDDEFLNKIFEPYLQEHMGYGRAYEGVGLGLSLVKKIVTLNNAVILVESKKGEGTVFTLSFANVIQPLQNLVPATIVAKTPPLPAISPLDVVLLVEDDRVNQLTIKRFLDNKYTVLISDSSDDVPAILKTNKVDIILMDISIWGEKDGLELTKDLKASKEFSHIPVIAITAHAFENDKTKALNAGCDDFLAKPFSKESILNMIESYAHTTPHDSP